MSVRSRSNLNFKVLVFKGGGGGGGETGVPGEIPRGAKERTNNKRNPHMASTPVFEPGPHWWEASALTTAPYLLPLLITIQMMEELLFPVLFFGYTSVVQW